VNFYIFTHFIMLRVGQPRNRSSIPASVSIGFGAKPAWVHWIMVRFLRW